MRLNLAWLGVLLAACGGGATTGSDGGPEAGIDGHVADVDVADTSVADLSLDSGCTTDADGDGHRAVSCGGDDCDDADPNAYPGNPERCDTLGHDEDCNPMTLGPDADHDGFVSMDCCNTQPGAALVCGTDCDDMEANTHPGAAESCNHVDDDCDGVVDDHDVLLTFFRDVDSDGYGDASMSMTACAAPFGYVLTSGDCDDTRPSVHPGGTEVCDGLDNDCDGTTDPGCACTAGATQMCGATDASGHLITTAPCHPGMQTCAAGVWGACIGAALPMPETCNMIDDDCNGVADDGARVSCYVDADRDTFALAGATPMMVCADSLGHCPLGYTDTNPSTPAATDCDDTRVGVHPGAMEACNMLDDDCNGIVDDGAGVPQYADLDHDGYGAGPVAFACSLMPGYVANNGDCNDGNSSIHPGASEICDGIDSNCDGLSDSADADANTWCATRPNAGSGASCGGSVCDLHCPNSNWSGASSLWDDCDRNSANGCETELATSTNCGSCGDDCASRGYTCCPRSPPYYTMCGGC